MGKEIQDILERRHDSLSTNHLFPRTNLLNKNQQSISILKKNSRFSAKKGQGKKEKKKSTICNPPKTKRAKINSKRGVSSARASE